MKRTPLIAGNWKMFKTGSEAVDTAKNLADLTKDISGPDIMIAPTYLSLPLVSKVLSNTNIKTGAQNMHFEKEGAFTGEVSADMIKDAGADYVIIGHSERRQFFGETDELVREKIAAASKAGLIPVMCIGETLEDREEKNTFSVLDKQVKNGVKGLGSDELETLVLAYEPVWAIGTGKTANAEQVDEVHRFLRSLLSQLFSENFAEHIRIVYGGSVKPENVNELMSIKDVDGALVGGASLTPEKFIKIIGFDQ